MILQNSLPYHPFPLRRLPGIQPLDAKQWLLVDEAYSAQMAERDRLFAQCPEAVVAALPWASEAVSELLDTVLDNLPPGFERKKNHVRRPDGVEVEIDGTRPLEGLTRLVQEDLCLMQKQGQDHVLSAASLCFPAGWLLEEKLGRPLNAIHTPVPPYDDAVARRVQRLMEGVQAGRPLWRWNAHWYSDPTLFQPLSEKAPRPYRDEAQDPFLRSERQVLWRLPRTQAVVFSIHTFVLRREDVPRGG